MAAGLDNEEGDGGMKLNFILLNTKEKIHLMLRTAPGHKSDECQLDTSIDRIPIVGLDLVLISRFDPASHIQSSRLLGCIPCWR